MEIALLALLLLAFLALKTIGDALRACGRSAAEIAAALDREAR